MVDDKHSIPDAPQDEPSHTPDDKGTPSGTPPPSSKPAAGWHEPPPDEESSRPVAAEAWYTPESASDIPATPEPDHEAETADLPDATPDQTGAWFTPIDAQLEALLAGAADTIVERHEPEFRPAEAAHEAGDTHVQAAADTQAQPAAAQDVTPPADDAELEQPAAERPVMDSDPVIAEEEDRSETVIFEPAAEPTIEDEHTPASEETPVQPDRASAEAAPPDEQPAAQEAPPTEPAAAQESSPGEAVAAQESPSMSDMPASDSSPADERQPGGGQQNDSQTAQPPQREPQPDPSEFEEVEQRVAVLRNQFEANQISREQLQNELRNMMILDDEGRWWMLGLETNRWYYFNGHDWVPETPPGYDQRVRGSAVRTETGMQEVVADQPETQMPQQPQTADIETDEDGMSLPRRVPQDDPGATLVSANAAFMEPVRPSDAPTQIRSQQVESDAGSTIEHPARAADAPLRSEQPTQQEVQAADIGEQTVRSAAVSDEDDPRPIPTAPAPSPRREPIGAEQAQPEPAKKYRIGEYPQPDYSVALGPDRNRNTYIRWTVRAVVIGVIGGMFLTLVVLLGMIGYYLWEVNRYADDVAMLTERTSDFETTRIFDASGTQMAEFSDPTTGLRTEVPLNQISPWLIHATVSTENETFYTDPGFSVLAIVRAAYQNIQAGGTVSGASTITQQIARALVLETEFASQRTTERKIVEIIVASEIKRKYSKNEILEIYLNEIFYGNFAYGIEAAAHTYFNKAAAELNPAESAFLAGLPQSPATYDPVVNREAALQRMHNVLRLMAEANGTGCITVQHNGTTPWGITQGQELCVRAEQTQNGETVYAYKSPNMPEWEDMTLEIARVEIMTFLRPEADYTHPHYVNYVWQQLEDEFGPQRIYSAGFRVTTTLDKAIQAASEQAVTDGLANIQAQGFNANNASVVVIRPSDGAVLAMVGSADYYNEDIKGQVNVAFTGQQPGSSIKPFVYLTAFEPDELDRYLTPASILWDVETNFNGYVPTNYDMLYHGPKTVRESLGNSLNVPAVKVIEFTTVERFTEMADRVGIDFPLGDPVSRQAGLQTALGGVEVQLFDMVAAYAMLANNGRRVEPYAITNIVDSNGNPVEWTASDPAGLQVVQPEYAYLVTSILSDPDARAEEFGYNTALDLSGGRTAAAKTGTSNDGLDVWTLGYTPQFAVGVWAGNTENEPTNNLTGFRGAAPIWNAVMEAAHEGKNQEPFSQPANIMRAEVCSDSGVQAFANCDRTHQEIFAADAPPPGPQQHIFVTVQVDGYTGKLVNEYCNDNVETKTFLNIDDQAAIDWLNNTPAGNQWLSSRGLQAPVPPIQYVQDQYCDPNEPRPQVSITAPAPNSVVQGTVVLTGTITMPNFSRYEIRYGISHDPQAFSEPLDVQTVQHPEPNAQLGQVDTTILENGPYTIRVVVIDQNGNDVVRDIPITVNNPPPTAVPQPAIPSVTPAPSMTPVEGDAATQPPIATATLMPTPMPTWTLTPTP